MDMNITKERGGLAKPNVYDGFEGNPFIRV